jgi:acetoin utilization deacetylase AcuC-like enzyme
MNERAAREEPIAIVDDERFDAHCAPGGGHPERPERLQAARAGLYGAVPQAARIALAAHEASLDELATVHDREYVRQLRALLGSGEGEIDGDTYFSRGSEQAAWLAAGGAAQLARSLFSGAARRAIALLRPPGHHAEPSRAMGFCMLNNVAVAAAAARASGARRVAIVDFDVHHGNGTQAAFYADPDVLFVSLHQFPLYPGTGLPGQIGAGPALGRTVNLALPADQGPETYGHAFRRVVLPVLDAFAADAVLISAGFDAHARDPLAQMQLDAASFGAMTSALAAHAERAGHGRVGVLLEGGYDLVALEQSVAAVARALRNEASELPTGTVSDRARTAIEATRTAIEPYWTLEGGGNGAAPTTH